MKKIQKIQQANLQALFCNKCGKEIRLLDGRPQEGVCSVEVRWGYFSRKDGELHSFDLCEDCYDAWVKQFALPVTAEEETELL